MAAAQAAMGVSDEMLIGQLLKHEKNEAAKYIMMFSPDNRKTKSSQLSHYDGARSLSQLEQEKIKIATRKHQLDEEESKILHSTVTKPLNQSTLKPNVQVNFQASDERYEFNTRQNNLQLYLNSGVRAQPRPQKILWQSRIPEPEVKQKQEKYKKKHKNITDAAKELINAVTEAQKQIKRDLKVQVEEANSMTWNGVGKTDVLTKWQLNRKFQDLDMENGSYMLNQPQSWQFQASANQSGLIDENCGPSKEIQQVIPDFTELNEDDREFLEALKEEQIQLLSQERNLKAEDYQEIEAYCLKLIQQEKERLYREKLSQKALKSLQTSQTLENPQQLFVKKSRKSKIDRQKQLEEELANIPSPQLQMRLMIQQENKAALEAASSLVASQVAGKDLEKLTETLSQTSKASQDRQKLYLSALESRKKASELKEELTNLQASRMEAEKSSEAEKAALRQLLRDARRSAAQGGAYLSRHDGGSHVASFLASQSVLSALEDQNRKSRSMALNEPSDFTLSEEELEGLDGEVEDQSAGKAGKKLKKLVTKENRSESEGESSSSYSSEVKEDSEVENKEGGQVGAQKSLNDTLQSQKDLQKASSEFSPESRAATLESVKLSTSGVENVQTHDPSLNLTVGAQKCLTEAEKLIQACIYCKLSKIYPQPDEATFRALEASHEDFVQIYRIRRKYNIKTEEDVQNNKKLLISKKLITAKCPEELLVHYLTAHAAYFDAEDPKKSLNDTINLIKSSEERFKRQIDIARKPEITQISEKYKKEMEELDQTTFGNTRALTDDGPLHCSNLKAASSEMLSNAHLRQVKEKRKELIRELQKKGKY